MSRNKKITDLDSILPEDEQYFVVATEDFNYKIPFGNVAEYSSIGTKSGQFTEHLSLNGNPALTGNPDGTLPDSMIDEINRRIAKDYSFIHFSDVENTDPDSNNIAYKLYSGVSSYYPEGTEYDDPIVTGVFVDSFDSLKISSIWDGPISNYMGSGFIHNQPILPENTKEIGYRTRRFIGHVDGINPTYDPFNDVWDQQDVDSPLVEKEVITHTAINSSNGTPTIGVYSRLKVIKMNFGPVAQKVTFEPLADITPRPGSLIGETHLKEDDIIEATFTYDVSTFKYHEQYPLSIHTHGIGLAKTQDYTDLTWVDHEDGTVSTTIPLTVTAENGALGVVFHTNNIAGIGGKTQDTSEIYYENPDADPPISSGPDTMLVDNTEPTIDLLSVTYPVDQQAIKNNEKADLIFSTLNSDEVLFETPEDLGSDQLVALNFTNFSVELHYLNGGYNIDQDNYVISALRKSNGIYNSISGIIKIANDPLSLSHDLPTPIRTGPTGEIYFFILTSTQKFLSSPTVDIDPSQSPISSLNIVSQGLDEDSNTFELVATDGDQEGIFEFQISARNLANIETTTTNSYVIRGFTGRVINASPRSLFAGLAYADIVLQSPNNLYVENLSEGGGGSRGGTRYFHESSVENGELVNGNLDFDNKFCICTEEGFTFGAGGQYIFNLDKLNRSANANVDKPAQFFIRGD